MIRILLDENLPKKLKFRFGEGYEVLTVNDMGWNSKKNGELLHLITKNGFDYLLTVDKNMEYQQNVNHFSFGMIILDTKDNRYQTVLPYAE
jgi:hypothetical protein